MKHFKTVSVLLALFFLFTAQAFCETDNATLIAVASAGREPDSQVVRAGRSPYFIIFDHGGNMVEAVGNPFADTRRQAGVSAVGFLYSKNVRVVIAESFGDRIESEIQNRSMRSIQKGGRADEAVKAFLQKE